MILSLLLFSFGATPDSSSLTPLSQVQRQPVQEPITNNPVLPASPTAAVTVVPPVSKEYEDIYQSMLKGQLIYKKPQTNAKIERPFNDPLQGTFDLSRCEGSKEGWSRFSTGFRM